MRSASKLSLEGHFGAQGCRGWCGWSTEEYVPERRADSAPNTECWTFLQSGSRLEGGHQASRWVAPPAQEADGVVNQRAEPSSTALMNRSSVASA